MKLVVMDGDGIGPEIVAAAVEVVKAADHRFNLGLELDPADSGLASLEKNGSTIPDETWQKVLAADGVILGPADTAVYPSAAEGGINPSGKLRGDLDLYANIRPSKIRPGVPAHVKAMDLVIFRENTEGFYAVRNMHQGGGEFMPTPDMAIAIRRITRECSERIARQACELAVQRRGLLSIVHKSNVLSMSDGFFVDCCKGVAADYKLDVDEYFVDAMAALLVRKPDYFDVVVTTNLFGDIISDLAAELSGGLGLGPSVNAGDDNAMAQAAHGAAPDIAGQNIANPTAMILSTSMLLDTLGIRFNRPELIEAAKRIDEAVDAQLSEAEGRTPDLGGPLGTDAFGAAVAARVKGGA
jgi:isocitrate/isopropylmalate dehydrogenase